MRDETFESAQAGAPRPILDTGEPLSDAIYDTLGPPFELEGRWYAAYAHGMTVRLTQEQATILSARRAHGTVPLAALSEIAFGRDISGLHWDELKPEEKRSINELAQSSVVVGWIERLALRGVPEPKTEVAPVSARVRAIWTIPAGHQNRKARRAAKAKQQRAAWHAFKDARSGRRSGMSSQLMQDLAGVLRDNEPTEKS